MGIKLISMGSTLENTFKRLFSEVIEDEDGREFFVIDLGGAELYLDKEDIMENLDIFLSSDGLVPITSRGEIFIPHEKLSDLAFLEKLSIVAFGDNREIDVEEILEKYKVDEDNEGRYYNVVASISTDTVGFEINGQRKIVIDMIVFTRRAK